MKKTLLIVSVLISLGIALSQPYVSGTEFINIYAGEAKTIEYSIINKDDKIQTFNIFISGFYREGVSIDVYPRIVTLEPNQEAKIRVYIEAKKFAREVKPSLFYLNIRYENQTIEKALILQVVRKFPVYISSIELSRYSIYPLESLTITTNIENVKDEITPNYKALFLVLYNNKEVFRKEKITDYIPSFGSIKISETFSAEKYQQAGKYEVVVRLYTLGGEIVDEAYSSFEVKPVEKIPANYTKKETKYSILEAYTRIEIKNEGNIVSKPFYLIESLPTFMKDFFYPYSKPDEVEYSFGYVHYKWLIRPLQPGETVIIEYKISIWQTWLVIIIILLMVFFFFRKTYTPTISKTVKKENGKIKVTIKIKNNSKSTMKEVFVEDFVPLMFKIVSYVGNKPEEIEAKKTKEKRLIWKINELKPDEEAIFFYYIQPLVELVSVQLPKSKLIFTNEKGTKTELKSNEVYL